MSGQATPRYRKRRPLPAVVLLLALLAVAVAVWVIVARSSRQATAPRECPTPSEPAAALGKALRADALNHIPPLPPSQVRVRVLNASAHHGAASTATSVLHRHGFARVGEPGNDAIYATGHLHCRGQIRFGARGARAARTLRLLAPCTQLVRDQRGNASVDLVLGAEFDGLRLSGPAERALRRVSLAGARQGRHRAAGGPAPAPGTEGVLRSAHHQRCS
jgi:hypothetical protein